MQKQREMNYELIRIRFVEIFEEYLNLTTQKSALTKMKEIVNEYDEVVEILDETLNCSIGIMDALTKGEIKDKKEEESVINNILKELKEKNYLGGE